MVNIQIYSPRTLFCSTKNYIKVNKSHIIWNFPHLIHTMCIGQGVKLVKQLVKDVHCAHRFRFGRHDGEADDVTKQNGDRLKFFCNVFFK